MSGVAYTAYGNQAVKLTVQNQHNQKTNLSKAVYIGTQDAAALEAAIRKHVN